MSRACVLSCSRVLMGGVNRFARMEVVAIAIAIGALACAKGASNNASGKKDAAIEPAGGGKADAGPTMKAPTGTGGTGMTTGGSGAGSDAGADSGDGTDAALMSDAGTDAGMDTCPMDPGKTEPGICGCGVSDANSDGDSKVDCKDKCPLDPDKTGTTGCDFLYIPGNVDPYNAGADPKAADATTTIDCATTLTTSGATPDFTTWCAASTKPEVAIVAQTLGGPEVVVVATENLTLAAGAMLTITGDRPAVFVVFGEAIIAGTIDAGAKGATPGPGGNAVCSTGTGAPGGDTDGDGSGAGGGGGFGSPGGRGADGDGSSPGGAGGMAEGTTTLIPLRGGCAGGKGGAGNGAGGAAGSGGGAVQISSSRRLLIKSTAVIFANGGGGKHGDGDDDGGGGGGSGGAILLEGKNVEVEAGAWITVNGGGGGGGNNESNADGGDAADGSSNSDTPAAGGTGASSDNNSGGTGGTRTTAAANGNNGDTANYGSGAGGGGAGRIQLNAFVDCITCPFTMVP